MKSLLALFCFGCFSVFAATLSPNFQGQSLTGKQISTETITKPGKLVLISFWATWCIPCIEELTTLKKKLEESPSFPLEVVTINVDDSETRSEVRSMIKRHGFNFETVLDPTNEILSKFQQSKSLPFSVLLNPKREIVATFSGYQQDMWEKISKASKGL